MKIVIPKERRPHELRVAATPETVKKFIALGAEVFVESGAGVGSSIPDALYERAGATIASGKNLYKNANLILKVQRPFLLEEKGEEEISFYPKDTILIAHLSSLTHPHQVKAYEKANITAIALERVPRITRAQSMDVLSSQSNLAGYKAVLEATHLFKKALPMMMTAAGTITPAKVLVMGAGVAGLQAIATARRLGAVVSAFDVRAASKEQVESLGATFIEVPSTENTETTGGYAKEVSKEYQNRQAAKIQEVLASTDIVITTALIPGKPAPILITKDMLKLMKPGSVLVDLAVEMGGNIEGSRYGETVTIGPVTILGPANMPSLLSTDASQLFARNSYHFVEAFFDKESKTLRLDPSDEIIQATVLTGSANSLTLKSSKGE